MARKSTKSSASTKRGGRKAEAPAAAVAEIEEMEGGMSFEDGIVLTTTILLLGAAVLAWMAMNSYA